MIRPGWFSSGGGRGGLPPDPPKAKGVLPRLNPITRALSWLQRGLSLADDIVPADLDVTKVSPGIDAYQDGWAVAEYVHVVGTISVVTPALNLFGRDPLRLARLLAIDAVHTAAAARTLLVRLTRVGAQQVNVFNASIPVGVAVATPVPVPAPTICPPDWSLNIANVDIVGGETMTINALLVVVPAGSHAPSL